MKAGVESLSVPQEHLVFLGGSVALGEAFSIAYMGSLPSLPPHSKHEAQKYVVLQGCTGEP